MSIGRTMWGSSSHSGRGDLRSVLRADTIATIVRLFLLAAGLLGVSSLIVFVGCNSGDDSCPENTSYTAQSFTNAVAHQGRCGTMDIANFLSACGDEGNSDACAEWYLENVASGAGGAGTGSPCGNCIVTAANNGAGWNGPGSQQGSALYPNYGACVQLLDPTNGAACGAALDNVVACADLNCGDLDAAICSTYKSAWGSKCAIDDEDGGVLFTCSPGLAMGATDPDFTFIINLICGGGADGGDDGDDAGDGQIGSVDASTTREAGDAGHLDVATGVEEGGDAYEQ